MDQTLAAAFAVHLRQRSDDAALAICEVLRRNGDDRRAAFLQAFVTAGTHDCSADWWAPGTQCRIGLLPPSLGEMISGHLWFDPLELNWSLAVPWPKAPGEKPSDFPHLPDFLCWFPLERVSDWQLAGAHQISPIVPAALSAVSAVNAWHYCTLFGKALIGFSTWGMIGDIFGQEVALRLWGNSAGEVSTGGKYEGDAFMLHHRDILTITDVHAPHPDITSDEATDGLSFRGDVDLQIGLIQEDHTLARVWNE